MAAKEVATIHFEDLELSQAAAAIVRAAPGRVWLCLTLADDGDIEVAMPRQTAVELINALAAAIDAKDRQ